VVARHPGGEVMQGAAVLGGREVGCEVRGVLIDDLSLL
jgi:hypothetical protein